MQISCVSINKSKLVRLEDGGTGKMAVIKMRTWVSSARGSVIDGYVNIYYSHVLAPPTGW